MRGTVAQVILAGVALTMPASIARADSYLEPSSGYQSAYDGSSKQLPDAQAGTERDPKWKSAGYTPKTAQVLQADGRWLLHLDHNGTTSDDKFNFYALDNSTGKGTNADFITLDIRFRLTDAKAAGPQLSLSISRPPTPLQASQGRKEHAYDLVFGREGIRATSGVSGGWVSRTLPLNNDWHNARLVINTRLSDASLYLDGGTEPALRFNGANFDKSAERNQIMFGDGGSEVAGSADIASIRWTNQDMAIPLAGGQVNFIKDTVVFEDPHKDTIFPCAFRMADGAIALGFSLGEHMKDEAPAYRISYDNGATWQTPDFLVPGISSTILSDGRTAQAYMWSMQFEDSHDIVTKFWDSSKAGPSSEVVYSTFKFPYKGQFATHRSLVQLPDGKLIQTIYGGYNSPNKYGKDTCYIIQSSDLGKTWSILSEMTPQKSPGKEGWNEPVMTLLKDGSLMALIRTEGDYDKVDGPVMQTKSTDGGKTWSTPTVAMEGYGVDPDLIQLKNGTLVASAGRPGVYIMVDFSGTGDHWQKIPIYDGMGSAYTTLIELEPNVVGLFYDESAMTGAKLPAGVTNRIMMRSFKVEKDAK